MKSFKENWTVKTIYAYLDLFLKLFPFMILIYIVPSAILLLGFGEVKLTDLDFFGVYSYLVEIKKRLL
jgi:hypothetical protein